MAVPDLVLGGLVVFGVVVQRIQHGASLRELHLHSEQALLPPLGLADLLCDLVCPAGLPPRATNPPASAAPAPMSVGQSGDADWTTTTVGISGIVSLGPRRRIPIAA